MPKMNYRRECFEKWDVPYEKTTSLPLVSRENFASCIDKIYSKRCYCLGYEAMKLFPDGRVQPDMEYSASFNSRYKYADAAEKVSQSIQDDPEEITHYDIVFRHITSEILEI